MQIDCIHIFSNAKFKVLHECSTIQKKEKKERRASNTRYFSRTRFNNYDRDSYFVKF